ncbi:MAG TPA: hypothetical protein VJL58_11550 [Pyrinomonadaceae bacterium]|nr:hypothetical protein [Pyrinomonadaceae bacterium]
MALIDVLNSLSLQPATPTNVQPGIPLSIGIVPDVSQVRTTEIQMVPLDLDFIGKGVIFPNANPADPTTTGPLPIQNLLTVPPSITPGVQGLLGKIKGNLPVAIPTDVLPRLDVTWQITDTAGNDMVASGDAIPSNGLNDVVLTALFLPEFVELTSGLGALGTSTRRVSATVTLTAGATVVGPRTIGPVDIIVPKLPIPTVLAMFVHKPYHGPTLIMVPADSAIPDLGGLAGQIQALQSALNPIRTIARLAALITGLDAITTLLNNEPHISFRKTDSISNLNDITLVQRSWYENDTEAEDELSSLFMIGPAGRAAEFFNDRGHDDGEGKFTFTVGPPLFAGIRDLHRDNPASEPLGNEIVVNHGPDGWWVDTFGDELSSVRFLPLAPIR